MSRRRGAPIRSKARTIASGKMSRQPPTSRVGTAIPSTAMALEAQWSSRAGCSCESSTRRFRSSLVVDGAAVSRTTAR
jgi:hypothetical protein